MTHRTRSAVLAALASFSLLVTALLVAQPAHAAGASYVALGDSYASGVGTRSYISDGTSCQRSTLAYPSLIAANRGYALTFKACSGAKVSDVTSTQLSALSSTTRFVTISVGGNDAGFSSVLTECAKPGWASNCDGKIDTAQSYINGTLPSSLSTLYASIKSKAPNAKVVVVGYPRIFNGEDCNAGTFFSPAEETRLNAMADLINSKISAQASSKGFTFANPTSRFVGHAVCDSPEWLNGLSNPVSDSYHPNKTGHASGYYPLVNPLLV
ncbi:lysophospholipase L1-like esterase [Marmoricola sp. OAE513]|uniref:SGNH/GDSL hydrolase family protein n=1 Tax=Marmoricola sp. OAE513 TaxID=2817894 RepID=UPI001AE28F6C